MFIDACRMRHVPARGLRLYANDEQLLLQTGMGKLRAASATAALLQARPDVSAVINVGVAGGLAEIGSVHLAHQVIDAATGRYWYSHLPPQRTVDAISTACVHTSDHPVTDYRENRLVDMEAAGVYAAATGYLSSDAIHCVKVISDNSLQSLIALDPSLCGRLLGKALPAVSQLAQWHRQVTPQRAWEEPVEALSHAIQGRIHHSVNDRQQLNRLLQRHLCLKSCLPDADPLLQLTSARTVRQALSRELQRTALSYAGKEPESSGSADNCSSDNFRSNCET